MYQKDYILRMIEMLGDFLRAIFGLINKGNYKQAAQEINEVYLNLLRSDAAFFRNIPADELTSTLIGEHHFMNEHLEVLAELFYAEAVIAEARNQEPESLDYYKKSLLLYEFIDNAYNIFSFDRQSRMNLIRKKTGKTEHPA